MNLVVLDLSSNDIARMTGMGPQWGRTGSLGPGPCGFNGLVQGVPTTQVRGPSGPLSQDSGLGLTLGPPVGVARLPAKVSGPVHRPAQAARGPTLMIGRVLNPANRFFIGGRSPLKKIRARRNAGGPGALPVRPSAWILHVRPKHCMGDLTYRESP